MDNNEDVKALDMEPADNDEVEGEVADILDELPKEKRNKVERTIIERTFGMIGQFSQESAISKKINEEHIKNYLDASRENMQKGFQERRENKIFIFILIFPALAFFVVLIILLKDKPELLEKIVYAVIGLVAGAFGGYGVGRRKGNSDD